MSIYSPLLEFHRHTLKDNKTIDTTTDRTDEQEKRLSILQSLTNSSKDIITTMLINQYDLTRSYDLNDETYDTSYSDKGIDKSVDKKLIKYQKKKTEITKEYKLKKKNLDNCAEKLEMSLYSNHGIVSRNAGVLYVLKICIVTGPIDYEIQNIAVSLNFEKLFIISNNINNEIYKLKDGLRIDTLNKIIKDNGINLEEELMFLEDYYENTLAGTCETHVNSIMYI